MATTGAPATRTRVDPDGHLYQPVALRNTLVRSAPTQFARHPGILARAPCNPLKDLDPQVLTIAPDDPAIVASISGPLAGDYASAAPYAQATTSKPTAKASGAWCTATATHVTTRTTS